jgi:uncharacterized glyoxalase superfamily protein PhnB
MQLANYLFFATQCEAALTFYTECGVGQVTTLIRPARALGHVARTTGVQLG